MGFRWKIVFSSIIVVAIAVLVSGYLLLAQSNDSRWDVETEQAVREVRVLCASVEDGPGSGGAASAGENADQTLQGTGLMFMLVSRGGDTYFTNLDEAVSDGLAPCLGDLTGALTSSEDGSENCWTVFRTADGRTFVAAAGLTSAGGSDVVVVNVRDVSSVSALRSSMLLRYRLAALAVFVICGAVVYIYSGWMTKPIVELAKASAGMASGDYSVRVAAKGDDEIGDLGRTFNFMADSVEEYIDELTEENRRKEEFVANFTHEIKTPMTSVVGYADMIRSRNLTDETRTLAADYIFNEGMRLQTMSLKLFDLFLTNEGNIELKRFALRGWMEDVAKSVFPKMYAEGVRLQAECPNISITGDPDLLKTAFINILDNARKASGRGGTVWLRARRKSDSVIIEVEDRGIGIPPEEIEKITEAFYMVDKSRSRESGGAGLGLALTQKILKLHGSKLEIVSRQGYGTIMRARLRVDGPEDVR